MLQLLSLAAQQPNHFLTLFLTLSLTLSLTLLPLQPFFLVMAPKGGESVKVVVRIRPLSSKEIQDGHDAVAEVFEDRGLITVRNPKNDSSDAPKSFTFDAVFGKSCTQRAIYDSCAAPIVKSALEGYNGTVFAYGQTGAGKTHTMEGEPDPPEKRGIIPNAFQHIFDHVALSEDEKYLVRASYFEIYQEEIRDLLSKDPKNRLELKESADSGVYVKDLTSFVVKSTSEIDHVMQAGKKNRSVGETLMNQASSRSHSVFTIVIECCSTNDRGEHIRVGKLNLVDLAGSERQSKTGATGDRLKEATKINLSLSALGNVISALIDGKSQHIPYRDSKLTRILQVRAKRRKRAEREGRKERDGKRGTEREGERSGSVFIRQHLSVPD